MGEIKESAISSIELLNKYGEIEIALDRVAGAIEIEHVVMGGKARDIRKAYFSLFKKGQGAYQAAKQPRFSFFLTITCCGGPC